MTPANIVPRVMATVATLRRETKEIDSMVYDLDTTDPHFAKGAEVAAFFARDAAERDRIGGRPLEQLKVLKESGLLKLHIPAEFGGAGEPWSKVLRIGRAFARTDGSFGHLYGYHFGALNGACLHGSPRQRERIFSDSAQYDWFWGNSGNSFSHSLFGRREGEYHVLNGHRPFSSGTHIADRIAVAWEDEVTDVRMFAAIPSDRAGVTILDDWDGIGQTQTGSGTVAYKDVRIHASEVLDTSHNQGKALSLLTPLIQQSVLLNVFLGTAQGALEAARTYTVTKSRPWVYSGYERHSDDPWVQRTYGELYGNVEAATLLADKAADALDEVWAKGHDLTLEARGKAAVVVAAANVFAGDVALKVTGTIFEVMGARSATKTNGFDRFWRNVRIHTLHNPAEYKARTAGTWFLTGAYPEPGTFR